MYLNKREKKKKKRYIKVLTTSFKIWTLPLTKIFYTNPPPMSMTTLISKLLPPFVMSDKGVSISSRHLVIAGWASIIVLITIIIRVTIVILVLRSLWGRRRRLDKTTKASLLSSNTVDTGVHLTQLITECVKASIHAQKLCHDSIYSHMTRKRKENGGGWSWRNGRSCHLCLGLLRFELCLAPSNGSSVYGT